MNARPFPAMEVLHRPRRLIAGVCAKLADRAGTPVWLPRTLFALLLVLHAPLALLIYAVLAFCWRDPPRRAAPPAPAAPFRESPVARFHDLEARLARLEAESLSGEAGLRRQFRDLR